jgi:hypothetical protein
MKKLKNPATPTRRTFYVEEYNVDIDMSEVYGGCRWISMKVSGTPDGMAMIELGVLGASCTPLGVGASPFYTSPTLTTTMALVFADATISWGGADAGATTFSPTAFDFTYQINAKTEPVIGSTTSPDVYDNDATLAGSISMLRKDLTHVTALMAETEFECHILLTEPGSEPKACIAFYIPRCKFTKVDAPLGGDGAMTESMPFMCGKKEGYSSTGYDETLLTISTSAA